MPRTLNSSLILQENIKNNENANFTGSCRKKCKFLSKRIIPIM